MRLPEARVWIRIALALIAVVFMTYMVLMPVVDALTQWFHPTPMKTIRLQQDMSLAEQLRLRTIEGVTAFWFFAFGAAIGSFLNVVVYRIPLGESLVFKRSRCPTCGTQIAGRDNVPILGWLLLGGRCCTCGTAISLRYPTIEMVVGVFFLMLYFVELISGGANLPIRPPNLYRGVVWIVFYTKWDLISIYLFHCALLCMLLTLALIDLDRKRLSLKAVCQFALLLAVPAFVFPHLLVVKVPRLTHSGLNFMWVQSLATVLLGAVSGLLAASAVAIALLVYDINLFESYTLS